MWSWFLKNEIRWLLLASGGCQRETERLRHHTYQWRHRAWLGREFVIDLPLSSRPLLLAPIQHHTQCPHLTAPFATRLSTSLILAVPRARRPTTSHAGRSRPRRGKIHKIIRPPIGPALGVSSFVSWLMINILSRPKFQSLPAAGQQADVTYTSPVAKEEPVKKSDAHAAAPPCWARCWGPCWGRPLNNLIFCSLISFLLCWIYNYCHLVRIAHSTLLICTNIEYAMLY